MSSLADWEAAVLESPSAVFRSCGFLADNSFAISGIKVIESDARGCWLMGSSSGTKGFSCAGEIGILLRALLISGGGRIDI
jgi:hypothetical protein